MWHALLTFLVAFAPPSERAELKLSNAELIAALPPARQEATYSIEIGRWKENHVVREWKARIALGQVSAKEIGEAFTRCGVIRSSPTWFVGRPYRVWMRLPSWLPNHQLGAKARLPDSIAIQSREYPVMPDCGNWLAAVEQEESYQLVGDLPPGATSVAFAVKTYPSNLRNTPIVEWSGEVSLPVSLIEERPPEPDESKELTEQVEKALGVSCANGFFPDGASIWFRTYFQRPLHGPLTSTLVNVEISLLERDAVISSVIIDDPDEHYGDLGIGGFSVVLGDVARNIVLRKALDSFVVRVRGKEPGPTNPWCRTRYWAGEFAVPLEKALEAECGMRPSGLCGPEGTVTK